MMLRLPGLIVLGTTEASVRRMALVAYLFFLAGCAGTNPPELDFLKRDADAELCRRGTGASAIAACETVLARGEPVRWVGGTGTYLTPLVFEARSASAFALAGHLDAAGRYADAVTACRKAEALLQRFEEMRPKEWPAGSKGATESAAISASVSRRIATAKFMAATSLIRLQRWDDSVGDLREATRGLPTNALVWGTLGVATNQTGAFDESAVAFERALAVDPKYFAEPRARQREVWDASKAQRRFDVKTLVLPMPK